MSRQTRDAVRLVLWQEELAHVHAAIVRGAETYHHTPDQPHLHTPALQDAARALQALRARLQAVPDLRRETPARLVHDAVREGVERAERIERRAVEVLREQGLER